MAWLFAQMWALELAAFLMGAGVTWLVFVRPARAVARAAAPALPSTWVPEPPAAAPEAAEPPSPGVATAAGPALAELDAHARHARRTGLLATGALDEITATRPVPVVPTQAESPDSR